MKHIHLQGVDTYGRKNALQRLETGREYRQQEEQTEQIANHVDTDLPQAILEIEENKEIEKQIQRCILQLQEPIEPVRVIAHHEERIEVPVQLHAQQMIDQPVLWNHDKGERSYGIYSRIDVDRLDLELRRALLDERQSHHQFKKHQHEPIAILMLLQPELRPVRSVPQSPDNIERQQREQQSDYLCPYQLTEAIAVDRDMGQESADIHKDGQLDGIADIKHQRTFRAVGIEIQVSEHDEKHRKASQVIVGNVSLLFHIRFCFYLFRF
jgi:hypothetical protein